MIQEKTKKLNFMAFKQAIQQRWNKISKGQKLFRVHLDKNFLWMVYLESFPEGTNPIYKTRTEHDCNCCKSFIKSIGDAVYIQDGKIVSIWDDIQVDDEFSIVAKAMADFVKSHKIQDTFLSIEPIAGVDRDFQLLEDGSSKEWNHFFCKIPSNLVNRDRDTILNDTRTNKQVLQRGLEEISLDSIDTVLDLIATNTLYRGNDYKSILSSFKSLKKEYDAINTDEVSNAIDVLKNKKELFCWLKSQEVHASICRIKNAMIGTFLIDLTNGVDLDRAVNKFEGKAENYKRPTALVTPAMRDKAKKELEESGYMPSLFRRHACVDDISINNLLFADRDVKQKLSTNPFDEISTKKTTKVSSKVEEITIADFIKNVLPNINSLEVFVENKHKNNFVTLVTTKDAESKNMFKWNNNFSWTYTNDAADSIVTRVKAAGGNTVGVFRSSLSWFNYDDLDLFLIEPNNNKVYFRNKGYKSSMGGKLDVDMNAGGVQSRTPVENIIYEDASKMQEGKYEVWVNNYNKRENKDFGFDMQIEIDGVIHDLNYNKAVKNHENIHCATITYNKKTGFSIESHLPSSTQAPKEQDIWNIKTENFIPVQAICLSPNYWTDMNSNNENATEEIGNKQEGFNTTGLKHYMFFLQNCKANEEIRPFFNEQLRAEFDKYRKALELVGSKIPVEKVDNELSGLGFSETKRNKLLVKTSGNLTRQFIINF